jgi:hypothetical protein
MRTWFRNVRQVFGARRPVRRSCCRPALESLEPRWLLDAGSGFVQTNLVSDIPGLAPHNTDTALVNPWGFTVSSRGEFLISDNILEPFEFRLLPKSARPSGTAPGCSLNRRSCTG